MLHTREFRANPQELVVSLKDGWILPRREIDSSLSIPNKRPRMATQTKTRPADPTVVDSKHYSVELENEQVRVLRISYGPGENSVMHSHPAAVAV